MNLKKIFTEFLNLDLRWKLRKVGKLLKINIYPNLFKFTGFKKFYTLLIFNLVFYSKFRKKKFSLYNKIKKDVLNKNKKKKFLISAPSSGTNFVRHTLSSYFELYYKIGNGIPKYNPLNDTWTFSISPIVPDSLWNSISINDFSYEEKKSKQFFSENEYQSKKIVFSRHPFGEFSSDLFSLKNMRPVVLFREPLDWLTSYYTKHRKNRFEIDSNLNINLIDESLFRIKNYYTYWLNFSKRNDAKDYLFIKFDELALEKKETFLEIFNFYDYDCSDLDLIDQCIQINSKKNSLTHHKTKYVGTRFMKDDEKIRVKKEIEEISIKKINQLDLSNLYKSLFN